MRFWARYFWWKYVRRRKVKVLWFGLGKSYQKRILSVSEACDASQE